MTGPDLPLIQLRKYRPKIEKPADFAAFWKRTLAQAAAHPIDARFTPVEPELYRIVNVHDVSFRGFDGQVVRGWLIEPKAERGRAEKLPCVVSYLGYGRGRALPPEMLPLAMAGVINLVMDTRGQGSSGACGATEDIIAGGPQVAGFFTQGIDAPESYYYRRYFTDAVRAIDAACAFPRVDASRLAVQGISQGGGTALVVAGLLQKRIELCMAEVPGLAFWRRGVEVIDSGPYAHIAQFIALQQGDAEARVFRTLSYMDVANFTDKITAETHVSCGLRDNVVAASTIFAAFNRIKAVKRMRVFAWNGHEGGQMWRLLETVRRLARWAKRKSTLRD